MQNDKLLMASAYIFGIPALYIILTGKRRETQFGYHGVQALFLWAAIFILYFALRFLVDLIWTVFYFGFLDFLVSSAMFLCWIYAVYLGYRVYQGEKVIIPYITDLAGKLA